MNLPLTIASVTCLALAFGHAAIGLRWVLPGLKGTLPGTPFGPPSFTIAMVRFTWHLITLMALAFGILLMVLAWPAATDVKTLLLRWFGAFWLAATAMACWHVRHRPRDSVRLPVPVLFMVVAVMCWMAST
jgi:hypothetical protein